MCNVNHVKYFVFDVYSLKPMLVFSFMFIMSDVVVVYFFLFFDLEFQWQYNSFDAINQIYDTAKVIRMQKLTNLSGYHFSSEKNTQLF